MTEFNRYVVEVRVVSSGPEQVVEDTIYFSVSAVSEDTVRSAIPLKHLSYVDEYEIVDVKEQNQ